MTWEVKLNLLTHITRFLIIARFCAHLPLKLSHKVDAQSKNARFTFNSRVPGTANLYHRIARNDGKGITARGRTRGSVSRACVLFRSHECRWLPIKAIYRQPPGNSCCPGVRGAEGTRKKPQHSPRRDRTSISLSPFLSLPHLSFSSSRSKALSRQKANTTLAQELFFFVWFSSSLNPLLSRPEASSWPK